MKITGKVGGKVKKICGVPAGKHQEGHGVRLEIEGVRVVVEFPAGINFPKQIRDDDTVTIEPVNNQCGDYRLTINRHGVTVDSIILLECNLQ